MAFIKLQLAKDNAKMNELLMDEGEGEIANTHYVECNDSVYAAELGFAEQITINTVMAMGESGANDYRIFTSDDMTAYKKDDGTVWLAYDLYEEAFC